MNRLFYLLMPVLVLMGSVRGDETQETSETNSELKQYLQQHPESDTDRDGVLGWWEKEQHLSADALEKLVEGTVHQHVRIPMRDGYEIMAEVFLPAEGGQPTPVVLTRAGYGRWGAAGNAKGANENGMAFVTMDVRRYDGGKHENFTDSESSVVQIDDMHDICEWLIRQPWCNGRIGTIGGSGNGFASNFKFPINRGSGKWEKNFPGFYDLLKGEEPEEPKSLIRYFLMGDVRDSSAPGNEWVFANTWPPESTKTNLYFHEGGLLSKTKPAGGAKVRYTYDPNDPTPSFGGYYSWDPKRSGPHDQRALRDRNDVLYFETAPLAAPVNVTGRISATLYISSSAQDTQFIVKLVDIYPDGYEAILREAPFMARYANGYDNPAPLENGKVYELDVDMWSTANVFNTGHRIGVIVCSAAKESYEVHPNTYEQIDLGDWAEKSVVAENTLHLSAAHPSHITLPVVE